MAVTKGIVQRLKIAPGQNLGYVYIGPSPTNTTLLVVNQGRGDGHGGDRSRQQHGGGFERCPCREARGFRHARGH